eukprot:1148039-Pelagomonas_calceolata.AAC.4
MVAPNPVHSRGSDLTTAEAGTLAPAPCCPAACLPPSPKAVDGAVTSIPSPLRSTPQVFIDACGGCAPVCDGIATLGPWTPPALPYP